MSEDRRDLVYLITGGCGFLGKHLLRLLLEKEDRITEIRVFDKRIDATLNGAGTEKTKVSVIQGDITDYSCVLDATRGVDVVIHTASLVDVWYKVPESVIYSVNVTGTENVVKACVACGTQYLLYTSSMEVIGPNANGDHFKRGNEDTPYPVKHTMAYPKSKAKAEKIVLEANGIKVKGEKSLYTCSLRPTGIYGEGHELIRDFHAQAVQRGGLVIGGIPNHIEHGRVYAGNVAWMHVLAARALMERPHKLQEEPLAGGRAVVPGHVQRFPPLDSESVVQLHPFTEQLHPGRGQHHLHGSNGQGGEVFPVQAPLRLGSVSGSDAEMAQHFSFQERQTFLADARRLCQCAIKHSDYGSRH
uniref:Hydroxy-delta-5-steroid dehydrogenase, 3 beta- and steroid delta-isomerase n=1 Tax=Oryzias latipes TaxID=8090 RepID=H2LA19_ORYLA